MEWLTDAVTDWKIPVGRTAKAAFDWLKLHAAPVFDAISTAMDRLIEFLPATLPAQGPTRIVHGDFRLDNLILHPERPEVELCGPADAVGEH